MAGFVRPITRALSWALPVLLIGATTAGAQALLLFGTWKLNPSRSALADPPPKSMTLYFSPLGADAVSGGEDTTYPDGSQTTTRYSLKTDGRDVPITGSAVLLMKADTISMRRLGSSTFVWTYKKNGAAVMVLRGVLSADGHTLTMTAPDNQVLVYEK